jgi:hypothetical protein
VTHFQYVTWLCQLRGKGSFSAIPPLVIREFPLGIPQAFAQGCFHGILSKSASFALLLHMILVRNISRFVGCIFISFFVLFPREKGRKASGIDNLRKSLFGGLDH